MEEWRSIRNQQERLSRIVERSKQFPPLPESSKGDTHRISGCLSKLWFVPSFQDGKCVFACDSDSAVVKGIAGLLCAFYSGATPAEILAHSGDILAEIGIQQHLTSTRRNGLGQIRSQIQSFAQLHQQPQEAQAPSSMGSPTSSSSPFPQTTFRLFDAHNHLQDGRFGGSQAQLIQQAQQVGVQRMVVNGSCEEDWGLVRDLAQQYPCVLPSFGYHPWYVKERTSAWEETLEDYLRSTAGVVGEIGLDRWIPDFDLPTQQEVFSRQLALAARLNLPVSIHCLKAWGMLEEMLAAAPTLERGFLLHSFGGPVEMIPGFAKRGAFFSFPGYFLQERKLRQRETFRHVPLDRLLVESDAPDQLPPDHYLPYPLRDPATQKPLNHPANLVGVYEGLATFLQIPMAELTAIVESNFRRLFETQG